MISSLPEKPNQKPMPISAAALVGLATSMIVLSSCISSTPTPNLVGKSILTDPYTNDGISIEEMQPLLADALKCKWSDIHNDGASCTSTDGYYFLSLTNNGVFWLEATYANFDGYKNSAQKNKRDRERVTKMVATLLPKWKEVRTWMAVSLEGSQSGYIDASRVQINELWVGVDHELTNASERGGTTVYITNDAQRMGATKDSD